MITLLSILAAVVGGYYFWTQRGGADTEKRILKVDGKQLFYGLAAYRITTFSEKDQRNLINLLVKNGWTGVSWEAHERIAWWPHGEKVNSIADYVTVMKAHCDKILGFVELCERAGLWFKFNDNNSNGDANKLFRADTSERRKQSEDALREVADYYTKNLSKFKNVLRLPVSEKDNDLNAGLRSFLIAHVEASWPDDRTVAYSERRPAARWTETHMGHIGSNAPGGGWTKLAVSDTGSIIKELTGSVTGGTMRVDAAKTFAGRMLGGGNSVDLYALGTGVQKDIIVEVGALGRENGV